KGATDVIMEVTSHSLALNKVGGIIFNTAIFTNLTQDHLDIGTSAFQNCSTLTSITLPEGVTSIGNDAFLGCTKLASIDIPNSVTSIGTAAFRNSGITSIVLPENLTSIANNTFNG
ncbi:MAG: leucine-rich repeat protein, partial [Chitinispirillales bacterium]|nr:leucine-rich repeat protein [Chitinispirillales bacterium]